MQINGLEWIDSALQMPLARLPVRTVVATAGRGRLLISPSSALTPDALVAAGAITDIVAPNLFSHRRYQGRVRGASERAAVGACRREGEAF